MIEAGLGLGPRDYRTMRLHTLPGPRPASGIWGLSDEQEDLQIPPAYQKLLDHGDLDRCGVTLLAGRAVGAPSWEPSPPASPYRRSCACSTAAGCTKSSILTSRPWTTGRLYLIHTILVTSTLATCA